MELKSVLHSSVEHKVKQDKLEVSQEPKTEIMSLNDDCIYAIFEFFTLNDLCLITQTCKRFQKLASNHFLRRYPRASSKSVITIKENNGKIVKLSSNNLHCFSRVIQTVELVLALSVNKEYSDLPDFIRSNFCENLKTIKISGGYFSQSFGSAIQNHLKNVEQISMYNSFGTNNVYDNILKYCPRINTLHIVGSFHVMINQVQKLPLNKYSTLESVWYQQHYSDT